MKLLSDLVILASPTSCLFFGFIQGLSPSNYTDTAHPIARRCGRSFELRERGSGCQNVISLSSRNEIPVVQSDENHDEKNFFYFVEE